jgi:hypothetical protein
MLITFIIIIITILITLTITKCFKPENTEKYYFNEGTYNTDVFEQPYIDNLDTSKYSGHLYKQGKRYNALSKQNAQY